MELEQLISVYSLVLNLAALMACLLRYVSKPRKSWVFAIVFFLGYLLSNYYWSIYILVMGDYPNVSSLIAYLGWNIALAVLPFLLREMRYPEEKGFFSPLCLLPVPLNIYQLTLYIPYGGFFNNIWQGGFATLSICMALNSILYYLKHKKAGAKPPFLAFTVFAYICVEYAMWTSTCFSYPEEWMNPYYYVSFLEPLCYLLFPFFIYRTYRLLGEEERNLPERPFQRFFMPIYITVVAACSLGGYVIAKWMRDTLTAGLGNAGDADPFSVIAVMLFVVSLVIVLFSLAVIMVVGFESQAMESQELKAAKDTAERSNEAKSIFLANMSHEIRTPLNAVLGLNEMILSESEKGRDNPDEGREQTAARFSDIFSYSGNLSIAGNNLLTIINDILDISKIEAGRMEIIRAEYKLSSLINDVSNMVALKARKKDLDFSVEVEPSIPDLLKGDEVRIRQIVTNILNNSVKYTRKGRVTMSVTAEEKTERGMCLTVTVSDTGIGIKPEDIDRLCTKFERVGMEENSAIEGTGLGLAITRSLLDMMEGTIRVESVYGLGSTFTVRIPQEILSPEPIGDFREKFEKSLSSAHAGSAGFRAPGARILVVDDTKMNLMVAEGFLKGTELRVDTAESGWDGVRLAGRHRYDIIFMDQRMPGMDGVTAMHTIREDSIGLNRRTPFVCLTADAVSGARERYMAEGFDDYLTKPFDRKGLEEVVLRHLPGDKVLKVDPRQEAGKPGPKAAELSERELLDLELGRSYFEGDEELYQEVLREYLNSAEEGLRSIQLCCAEENWEEYGILVHALKSSSRTIGAVTLGDRAAAQEKAAKAGDGDAVRKGHDELVTMYKAVTERIRKII